MKKRKQFLLTGPQIISYATKKVSINIQTSSKFTRTDIIRDIFSLYLIQKIDVLIKFILTTDFHPSNAMRSFPSSFMSEFTHFLSLRKQLGI